MVDNKNAYINMLLEEISYMKGKPRKVGKPNHNVDILGLQINETKKEKLAKLTANFDLHLLSELGIEIRAKIPYVISISLISGLRDYIKECRSLSTEDFEYLTKLDGRVQGAVFEETEEIIKPKKQTKVMVEKSEPKLQKEKKLDGFNTYSMSQFLKASDVAALNKVRNRISGNRFRKYLNK